MKYSGGLNAQISQWFNEHFTFDASHIPDTEEAYPEYEKFADDFVNSITYDDAKKCYEDLNSQRYDYEKLELGWIDDIYKMLKDCAERMVFFA